MIEQQKTILFLEDDENDILLVRRVIKKLDLNANFRFCQDGTEGLKYLKGEGKYADREEFPLPSLIILDIKLPKVSGLEVVRWIKKQEDHKNTPVIMLSSSGQPGDILKAYEFGANSFLVKPVEFSQFIEMLETIYTFWIKYNHFPNS